MPQTQASSSTASRSLPNATEVALRAANEVHGDRVEAEATYARLIVKSSQLSKSEESELAAAVRLLNYSREKVAADARAVDRARVLRGIITKSTSPQTEAAVRKAVHDVESHYAQTEIYLAKRQAELEVLATIRHEAESLAFSFNSAGTELAALAKEHPIINGLTD